MPDFQKLKEKIIHQLTELTETTISEASSAIASAKEARDNESKSSAGDKYETGRAMMQVEIEKYENQLQKTLFLKNELSKINLAKKYGKVENGSLVITDNEKYFISIGIGKIMIENENIYAISLASPVGILLKDKQAGDRIQLNGKEIMIRDII